VADEVCAWARRRAILVRKRKGLEQQDIAFVLVVAALVEACGMPFLDAALDEALDAVFHGAAHIL